MPARSSDPTDVFPRRNLPGSSEQWGRTVEDRQVATEGQVKSLGERVQSLGRSTASSLASLTDQMNRILDSVRVIGSTQVVTNVAGTTPIIPGGSMVLTRPSWATHALVEFTTITLTDPGDISGEVAVTIVAYDSDDYLNPRESATALVDGIGAGIVYSTPLAIEVPSGVLEYAGYVEQTIAGSGSASVQIFSKVTWIARGIQTTGDIE